MKTKEFIKNLHNFAMNQNKNETLSPAEFERSLNLIFRYLASMPIDECIDTLNQMIKSGTKINKIEGKLREKLTKKKAKMGWFSWARPMTNSFDFLWQETARIFNPASSKI